MGAKHEMKYRSARELRELFLSYFEGRGCRRHQSFSLIPDDPTLMFTVAGMVPFKPYFLGLRTPDHTRATTAQKCIRTNDIDNVGRTARHHTFFEMLGNFSFGDYFKKEIIPWAWELLTERVGLDPDRLYATVYLDDDEAADMWHELVGMPKDRIFRLGEDDNFWAAGPVGPCGPCSEIIYDQGPEFSCGKPTCGVGCDCDRYLEIWNLVFMQFSRDEAGTLSPLPKKNIDTGMGLERLASVVQRVKGDFETDLFRPIIDKACEIGGVRYGDGPKSDLAVRVISDHLRASAFMIADGVLPSNEGPGYVLRRIIRRSARFGRLLGIERPFLLELLPVVDSVMADPYKELIEQKSTIEQVISNEEESFGRTLNKGIELLDTELSRIKGADRRLNGEVAFTLYDTYGFPLELTEEICAEAGVTITQEDFDRAMEGQRERARASSKQTSAVIKKSVYTELFDKYGATTFDGYDAEESDAEIIAIIAGGELAESVPAGAAAELVLNRTPFYGERGGQVGDTGEIVCGDARFIVENTTHPSGDLTVHAGRAEGEMRVGMKVKARIDGARRASIRRHHTATHLLHEALTRVLGKHVRQAGSLVTPTFLRFDYNHFQPMTHEEIVSAERMICEEVLKASEVTTTVTGIEDAKKLGAKALFEEKYGDVVRVVSIPGFSAELCGGTHARNTGEIGLVKIIRDEGIGSGVRRINAVAGMTALGLMQNLGSTVRRLTEIVGGDMDSIVSKAEELLDEKKILERKTQEMMLRNVIDAAGKQTRNAKDIDGITLVADTFGDVSRDILRKIGDNYKASEKEYVLLLAGVTDGQVTLVGMASDGAIKRGVNAGALVKEISGMIKGSGGGKPAMGQGGGKDPSALKAALEKAEELVRAQMGK